MANLATAIENDFNYPRAPLFSHRHAFSSLAESPIHHFLHIVAKRTKMGLGGRILDPGTIISHEWSRNIQIVSLVSASFSLIGTSITVYWFFMMRRNFRRNLVLNLIVADFYKSLWYFSFSALSLHRGSIESGNPTCQALGWFIQASSEGADYAIFVMSVHMYLQIFNTTSKIFGHDGLYRFRHTVIALYFVFPSLMASLAFVRGREGYILQGPFCTLPIRPYWYRLALQWIPRYLILLWILFVAIRIYLHVGQGLQVFARENDKPSHDPESVATERVQELQVVKKRAPKPNELQDVSALIGPSDQSLHPSWPPTLNQSADGLKLPSGGQSRRGSRIIILPDGTVQHDSLQIPPDSKVVRNSISTISSDISMEYTRPPSPTLEPISEFGILSGTGTEAGIASEDTPLKKRRQAIQRQLRLLFIYPLTYMIIWTIPFIYHSMNYSDRYASHPIPVLAMLSTFCLTFAGFVDCLVFGWREKPWQHVPGSDGTFTGSFKFWTFKSNLRRKWSTPAPAKVPALAEDDPVGPAQKSKKAKHLSAASRQTSTNSTKPIMSMHKKTYSGTSDRATRAAEQAAERLAFERHDRESRIITARASTISPSGEWFERPLSECISPTREKFPIEFEEE